MSMGLYSAAADIGNVNPSTLLNMVGIGFDSGQTTLRLLRNDGSGAATAAGHAISHAALLAEQRYDRGRCRTRRGQRVRRTRITA